MKSDRENSWLHQLINIDEKKTSCNIYEDIDKLDDLEQPNCPKINKKPY